MTAPRVALVHDYLLVMRGAERTFAAIAECWPDAPIYTLLYDENGTEGRFAGRDIRTSHLQRLGVGQRGFRRLLPAFPWAVKTLPVHQHDLVISSSSAFAHGVRAANDGCHVCYCHSPFRYAWFETQRALAEVPVPLRPALQVLLAHVRAVDRAAAQRVTRYVSNSEITRERLVRYWNRSSTVVHPPVEVERFRPGVVEPWFLVVTELVAHKSVEIALEAARRAGVPIRIVGEGPDRARLEAAYSGTRAEFLGRIDDLALSDLYSRARALVVPNVEEFGITALEAQAAGRPVVGVSAGGALETVIDGKTGVLAPPDDVDALASALASTEFERFEPERLMRHAEGFSTAAFQGRLRREVELAHEPSGVAQAAGTASPVSVS